MEASTDTQEAERPETAEGLMRKVRKYTWRKMSAEEKIRIVLEGMKQEMVFNLLPSTIYLMISSKRIFRYPYRTVR